MYRTAKNLQINVLDFVVELENVYYDFQPASYNKNAASDQDFYGWTDLDYDVISVRLESENNPMSEIEIKEWVNDNKPDLESAIISAL